jgi:arginase
VLGVPTSAGAFAPGQEQAPAALREAGLLERLCDAGATVTDHGDREVWRWRPDHASPRAQHVAEVVAIVRETAGRVARAADAGEVTVVLGGDCTVGIGTVAGHVSSGGRVGLVYFDSHADLNVPAAVRAGALDWMGVAHMLGEDGAVPELVHAGPRAPLLAPEQVLLLGWGSEQATPFERDALARRGIDAITVDDVAADPTAAARRAAEWAADRCDRLVVHFDVDVIDFADEPLSENTGRNEGLAFDAALTALAGVAASPLLAGVTVTELNPAHAREGGVERFAAALARALA